VEAFDLKSAKDRPYLQLT